MAKTFLAGPANAYIYSGKDLIATAKTLVDSSTSIGSTVEELRGGKGNQLLGKYFHDSTLSISLTDALFRLEYIAMQTGSTIKQGADTYATEQVTLGAAGAGVITGTPIDFNGFGVIGWVSKPGDDETETVTFTGKNFTYPGGEEGEIVCVRYYNTDSSSRQMSMSANFIPSTVRLVLEATLFAADSGSTAENATVAGKLTIEIPRFQLDGAQEISMSATGVANAPISGSALRVDGAGAGCDSDGVYGTFTETLFGTKWYDNVYALAIAGGDIDVTVGATATLSVMAIPKNAAAFPAPLADLTFTAKDTAIATVGANTGVVSGVAAGTTSVSVVITNKPEVEDVANIIVATA